MVQVPEEPGNLFPKNFGFRNLSKVKKDYARELSYFLNAADFEEDDEDELLFDWDLFEAEESIAEDSEGSTCETKTWDVDQLLHRVLMAIELIQATSASPGFASTEAEGAHGSPDEVGRSHSDGLKQHPAIAADDTSRPKIDAWGYRYFCGPSLPRPAAQELSWQPEVSTLQCRFQEIGHAKIEGKISGLEVLDGCPRHFHLAHRETAWNGKSC